MDVTTADAHNALVFIARRPQVLVRYRLTPFFIVDLRLDRNVSRRHFFQDRTIATATATSSLLIPRRIARIARHGFDGLLSQMSQNVLIEYIVVHGLRASNRRHWDLELVAEAISD